MYIEKPDYHNLFFERPHSSVGELFYENTKLSRLNSRPFGIHIGIITSISYYIEHIVNAYKCYPHSKRIVPESERVKYATSRDRHDMSESVKACLQERRSIRHFSSQPLALDEVKDLLMYGAGVTKEFSPSESYRDIKMSLRAFPSAGALYPLEVYLISLSVQGIGAGIYHYNVRDNVLEILKECDPKDLTRRSFDIFTMSGITNPGLIIPISAVFRRTTFKYMDRGYRFIFIEAGHLGQNFSLLANALGLGSVELGGYLDDEVNDLLGIDGVEEGVVNCMVFGKPQDEEHVDGSIPQGIPI